MMLMDTLIDEKMKSLSERYDKVYKEQLENVKELESLSAQYQVLAELKEQQTTSKPAKVTGGTAVVKGKEK